MKKSCFKSGWYCLLKFLLHFFLRTILY